MSQRDPQTGEVMTLSEFAKAALKLEAPGTKYCHMNKEGKHVCMVCDQPVIYGKCKCDEPEKDQA